MKIACSIGTEPAEAAQWVADIARALPDAQVSTDAEDADYAVVWRAPQAFFDRQTRLKAIFAASAGVDSVLSMRLQPGVQVVRLEDAGMGAQMAEYVVHAILRHVRRFDDYAVLQTGRTWQPLPPESKSDWPVGILGMGVLGSAVANAVRALGFPVLAWTRTPRDEAGVHAGEAGFAPFLSGTRILVNMLPLTPQTRDLIDASVFAQLKAPAYFINVARGDHVVEADLLAALDAGTLAGATLDVCRNEPASPDHPFWTHPHIVLTPHISAVTLRSESVAQIAAKITAFEGGALVSGLVSRERGY